MMINYDVVCETCGVQFAKKRSEKLPVPRFCSNKCKFGAMIKDRKEFVCQVCDKRFTKYVPPSDYSGVRLYCSRRCQMLSMKLKKGQKIRNDVTFICKECNTSFTKKERSCDKPFKFCSTSCAAKFNARDQRSYDALYARWKEKFGEEEAHRRLEQNKLVRSKASTNCNLGKLKSEETRKRISASCTGICNVLKGKTFEEFYGPLRAAELSNNHSKKLKEGYITGRLTPTARTKSAPTFRGIKLRSQLEQRAIEFLEKRDALTFGTTLLYEDKSTRAQWIDALGKQHTYHPDLHDVKNGIVYEVKPAWKVNNPTEEMQLKYFAALKEAGKLERAFRYLTDKDID